jgi:hypothetical protein
MCVTLSSEIRRREGHAVRARSKIDPDEIGRMVSGRNKAARKRSRAALASLFTRRRQRAHDPVAGTAGRERTTLPDEDLLERTDFWACILRHWPAEK